MKSVMTRAWEIYRTLEGDHRAKLSLALRQAWEETKKPLSDIEQVKAAVGNGEIKIRVRHIKNFLGCELERAMEIFDILNPDIAEKVKQGRM